MWEYDILADMILFSEDNGGRRNLPPIREKEYTYRPMIKFNNTKYFFCCGIIIGSYISNYEFNKILRNVKIIFMNRERISECLFVGNKFEISEGLKTIGSGTVVSCKA